MKRPRRPRTALLVLLALTAAAVVGALLWLGPTPEPNEPSLMFADSPAERDDLKRALREGRVRLPTREEFDALLTPEQRELAKRGPATAAAR